jgi:excinuclease UvrABC ATPase subunit
MGNSIIIKGAREHNLKNIDVEIPRDKLVMITGLSGSGRSSLAFDTIYAEGNGAMSSRCRPACASLLTMINAMVKNGTSWRVVTQQPA